MKKSLILVVALLCMASLMAAMAFTTASVDNHVSVSLVDTQGALLALEGNDEHAAVEYMGSADTDKLKLNLDRGFDNKKFGIQPSSTYTWDDLFKVTNNSEYAVKVTIKTDTTVGGRLNLYASSDGKNWSKLMSHSSSGLSNLTFNLAADAAQDIDIKTYFEENGWAKTMTPKLIVEAEKID